MKKIIVAAVIALVIAPAASATFGYVDPDDSCPNIDGVQPFGTYYMKYSHRYSSYICVGH